MTKNERLVVKITKIIDELVDELDLHWCDINLYFNEAEAEDDQSPADVRTEPEYRRAKMTWTLPLVAPLDDETIEEHAIHELSHVLMGPIHKYLKGHRWREELATQNIARAIQSARRHDDGE
jgi:hypothetical protein